MLAGMNGMEGEPELLAVMVALAISLGGFFMLIGVDNIKDRDCGKNDEKIDKALECIMSSISLTIGFSWEQCFDLSVDSLAEKSNDVEFFLVNSHTTKFFLSLFCAGLLVPAWLWYILPYVLRQGWKFGWVLNLPELLEKPGNKGSEESQKAKKLMQAYVKTIGEQLTDIMDAKPEERLAKVTKSHKVVEEASAASLGDLEAPLLSKAAPAGDKDADTLRKENKELKEQLETYKSMFDGHMETMTSNLRKMNDTMNRIESGLPQ